MRLMFKTNAVNYKNPATNAAFIELMISFHFNCVDGCFGLSIVLLYTDDFLFHLTNGNGVAKY